MIIGYICVAGLVFHFFTFTVGLAGADSCTTPLVSGIHLLVGSKLIRFLGGLSLHLNHLIAERVSAPYWQFGTLPIGIFLSNLVSGQLETSLMTSYCHF